jgi:hypothetical protein
MPDDLAAAVRTPGRQGMDGALETVENMDFAIHAHFKGFVVVITAYFACSHAVSWLITFRVALQR